MPPNRMTDVPVQDFCSLSVHEQEGGCATALVVETPLTTTTTPTDPEHHHPAPPSGMRRVNSSYWKEPHAPSQKDSYWTDPAAAHEHAQASAATQKEESLSFQEEHKNDTTASGCETSTTYHPAPDGVMKRVNSYWKDPHAPSTGDVYWKDPAAAHEPKKAEEEQQCNTESTSSVPVTTPPSSDHHHHPAPAGINSYWKDPHAPSTEDAYWQDPTSAHEPNKKTESASAESSTEDAATNKPSAPSNDHHHHPAPAGMKRINSYWKDPHAPSKEDAYWKDPAAAHEPKKGESTAANSAASLPPSNDDDHHPAPAGMKRVDSYWKDPHAPSTEDVYWKDPAAAHEPKQTKQTSSASTAADDLTAPTVAPTPSNDDVHHHPAPAGMTRVNSYWKDPHAPSTQDTYWQDPAAAHEPKKDPPSSPLPTPPPPPSHDHHSAPAGMARVNSYWKDPHAPSTQDNYWQVPAVAHEPKAATTSNDSISHHHPAPEGTMKRINSYWKEPHSPNSDDVYWRDPAAAHDQAPVAIGVSID